MMHGLSENSQFEAEIRQSENKEADTLSATKKISDEPLLLGPQSELEKSVRHDFTVERALKRIRSQNDTASR